MSTSEEPAPEQAPEEVSGRLVTLTMVSSVAVTVICVAISSLLLLAYSGRVAGGAEVPSYPVASTVAGIHQTPIDGPGSGIDQVAAAERALTQYGWVDRRDGVVRIPIDRAIAWLVDDARNGVLASPDPAVFDGRAGGRAMDP